MARDIDISHLTSDECIELAQQLWDKARAHADTLPASAAQLEELRCRIDAQESGELPPPEPWEAVKARLRSR